MSGAHAITTTQRPLVETAVAQISRDHTRIEAEVCRRSLFTFVQAFWSTIIQAEPVWNWHIPYLCRDIQRVISRAAQGKPKLYDVIYNIPPGETKSTLVVQMAPAWAWTNWPWMRFLCGSYSGDLATEHGGLCKDIVSSEKYQRMYPDLKLRRDHDARSNFRLVTGGQRMATSVGGTSTGKHAHVIMVDDPLNPYEATSDVKIKTANTWMDQTLSTRKVDKKVVPTILVMQRLAENDPTGNWVGKKGKRVHHICLPGQCRDYEVKPEILRGYYKDDLLDPQRMDWSVLNDMYLDLGEYGFAGQVGQNPSPPSGGMFKIGKLEQRIVDLPPAKLRRVVRYWDKAGTEGGGAYTAGVKMAEMANGDFVIMDVVRGQWGPDKRERMIRDTAEEDGRRVRVFVEQEPGSGGKDSAYATLKTLSGFSAFADRPTGDKIYRADPLASRINGGHVYLLKGTWNKAFIDELRLFPNGTYKDQVDGASGAFSKLFKRKRAGALRPRDD